MNRYFVAICLLLIVPFSFSSVFGTVEDFTTNKSLYHQGDQLVVTGNVSYDPSKPKVIIQVLSPANSFADFSEFFIESDGSFSGEFGIGPTWSTDGVYTIKVTYNTKSLEDTVEYKKIPTSEPESAPEPRTEPTPRTEQEPRTRTEPEQEPRTEPTPSTEPESIPEPRTEPTPELTPSFTTLKLKIPDFPSLDEPPQYYIDRYHSEPDYKSWFDVQFPSNSIEDVVGYKSTIVDGFPSLDKSPQYYINRYHSEPDYKSWFDVQFPTTSIYNILGYKDVVLVPDWIRVNAEWWATGKITDSMFVTGIKFMLENNIIIISDIPTLENTSTGEIPERIRDNVHQWSQYQISEDEFAGSLKFLIQEGFIIID